MQQAHILYLSLPLIPHSFWLSLSLSLTYSATRAHVYFAFQQKVFPSSHVLRTLAKRYFLESKIWSEDWSAADKAGFKNDCFAHDAFFNKGLKLQKRFIAKDNARQGFTKNVTWSEVTISAMVAVPLQFFSKEQCPSSSLRAAISNQVCWNSSVVTAVL